MTSLKQTIENNSTLKDWKNIWDKKSNVDVTTELSLEKLIELGGFNHQAGGYISKEVYIEYASHIIQKANDWNCQSVLEIGCGAGLLLNFFYSQGYQTLGCDYSQGFIKIAQKLMPNARLFCQEANQKLNNVRVDLAISHSVFHYFPNQDYALSVLKSMATYLNDSGLMFILDVNDLDYEKDYIQSRIDVLGQKKYNQLYQNLRHLFYSKDFFAEFAQKNSFDMEIETQQVEGYSNSQFRYNVFMKRK